MILNTKKTFMHIELIIYLRVTKCQKTAINVCRSKCKAQFKTVFSTFLIYINTSI